jgi:hypothetical protein
MSNLVIRTIDFTASRKAEDEPQILYEIGHWEPTGGVSKWHIIEAYATLKDAKDTFHYLHGGNCFCRGDN